MNFKNSKILKERRRMRIRKTVLGDAKRPRLSLHFSGKHIYAQCLDDQLGKTLIFLSTLSKEVKGSVVGTNVEQALKFGEIFGRFATEKGITDVVFDRGIKRYHGKVKAFADSVRSTGVKF